MLKSREPFRELGADYYHERYKERKIRNLHQQAKQLGLRLVPDLEPCVS